jgi:hypothetical protein
MNAFSICLLMNRNGDWQAQQPRVVQKDLEARKSAGSIPREVRAIDPSIMMEVAA